ncbi:MAG: redoxin domain-containing protein [Polyangiaceae bacterium]|nr:redoxin domain-containing protein [Polyangiaceae bacterium]
MKEFEAKGIRIVAISSDEKEVLAEAQRDLALPFPLLSDADEQVIKRYGLVHAGANNGQDIARPAEILLDGQGVIRWAVFSDNLRVAPRPEDVLEAAAKW